MRTTLDIDEDIMVAIKDLARRSSKSAGKILSDLARQTLTKAMPSKKARSSTGFRAFASRGTVVSDEIVDALRDSEGV
jgi:hypothetical protein